MKSEIFLSVALVVSAAGGGYWLGQRNAHSAVTASAQPATNGLAGGKNFHLPVLPVMATTTAGTNGAAIALAKLSLAEVEAKILELKKKGPMGFGNDYEGEQDMTKLLLAIDAADIPAVLAFCGQKSLQADALDISQWSVAALGGNGCHGGDGVCGCVV